ncbi:TPA: hypothetical protein DCL30_00815 [Candidatus Peribacteria bacterium]|nr:MAG: hypothetical protein A2529_01885 [Candidatus Peribacteria bacterium RIFOXYD2_FULL_58_15]HAI98070.1 hypothetical protein [Candidatus Peribacteria bacterium]HAS33888.1 hypothetical protein [Candidatus Peribacteria bacterium]
MTALYIFLGVILAAVVYNIWTGRTSRSNADPALKAELDQKMEEIGELKRAITEINRERSKKEGEAKQLWATYQKLESDHKATMRERDSLQERIAKFEAERDARERRHEEMIKKLESAEHALDDERKRIRREDEERLQHELEERDRLWNDHERAVVATLTDLCKKQPYSFTAYDNTNLPEGFHGTLKPDFLIDFLDQYVIFDAKVSKSSSLQTYIADQVKSTAKKVKGKEKIYPTIFLVVPTDAMKELKKTSYYEDGFMFYVIPPEALEPILASLKKISRYEFAKEMDPQQRENIVDLIAHFDFHISARNAHDLLLIQHGLETIAKVRQIDPDLAKEAAIKKTKIRNLSFNTAQEKLLTSDSALQQEQVLDFVQPKAKITREEVARTRGN